MKPQDDNQSSDQRKKIMVIGITAVMVVVAAFWIFNFKSFVNPYSEKLIATESEKVDWKDLKGRFDKTMSDVVGKMDQIEAKRNAVSASSSLDNLEGILNAKIGVANSSSTSLNASSSSSTEELKIKLDDMEKSLKKK